MTNSPRIDHAKVRRAVMVYGKPEPAARKDAGAQAPRDAALRKTLTSHGRPCRGWDHPNFLH